jgi:hypothetical protein
MIRGASTGSKGMEASRTRGPVARGIPVFKEENG